MTTAEPAPLPVAPPCRHFVVRHGAMRFLGDYEAPADASYARGQPVIVRGERGQEAAEVLCDAIPEALKALPEVTRGQILRAVTPEDQKRIDHLREIRPKEYESARRLITQHRLAM